MKNGLRTPAWSAMPPRTGEVTATSFSARVQFYLDNVAFGSPATVSAGSASVQWPTFSLPDGAHAWTAADCDLNSCSATRSAPVDVTIDNAVPAFSTPAGGATVSGDVTVAVTSVAPSVQFALHTFVDVPLPSSLSARAIEALRAKGYIGFAGVVVSDDMEMGALRDRYSLEERVVRALNAGVDLLVFSNVKSREADLGAKIHAIIAEAVRDGRISRARIESAYEKIAALKRRLMAHDLAGGR